jgi:hypothetical protein
MDPKFYNVFTVKAVKNSCILNIELQILFADGQDFQEEFDIKLIPL